MSVSVFNHPYLRGLLGEAELAKLFTAEAELSQMLAFELAIARSQSEFDVIPVSAVEAIEAALADFTPDIEALCAATARDGVVVAELVSQLRDRVGGDEAQFVHFGVTSQDVIDTSLALRLKSAVGLLTDNLGRLLDDFDTLISRFGTNKVMARTRMKNAVPTSVLHCVDNWRAPLRKCHENHIGIRDGVGVLQLGGAVGNNCYLDKSYKNIAERTAQLLELGLAEHCWHTDRSGLADLANWLSQLTGGLGKIGQDILIMGLDEIGEIKLSGGGKSSVMTHKQNPVKAEILVTLARFNACQLPAMHHALVHENYRSGSSWSLEWMVLPQMIMATAASLRTGCELLENIEALGNSQ